MDISIQRLKQSLVIISDDKNSITIYDESHGRELFFITNRSAIGDFVVEIYNDSVIRPDQDNVTVSTIWKITSYYTFEYMSRRAILDALNAVLNKANIYVLNMGVFYYKKTQTFIHKTVVPICFETFKDTGIYINDHAVVTMPLPDKPYPPYVSPKVRSPYEAAFNVTAPDWDGDECVTRHLPKE